MTRIAAPAVISCPHCQSPLLKTRLASFNDHGSVYWSDGYTSYMGIAPFGPLGCCRICEALFWLEDAEHLGTMPRQPDSLRWSWAKRYFAGLIGEIDAGAEAAWKATPDTWHWAPKVEDPRARELLWALEQGLGSTPKREIYLRTQLWWAGNHPHRGSKQDQPMTLVQIRQNMTTLLECRRSLPHEQRDVVIEGELLRELGCFGEASNTLQEAAAGGSVRAAIILARTREGDANVCEVGRSEFSF